ncbi:unnamed protein product [Lathyrus sativus]|nr:unnamed protein product [Lathyrus sativus]
MRLHKVDGHNYPEQLMAL